jgi:hypothetical protein
MTQAAAPIERVGQDQRPPIAPAQAAALQEACAAAAAIYPYSTFRRWLDEGGFEDARRHNLPGPFPVTLIAGRRR